MSQRPVPLFQRKNIVRKPAQAEPPKAGFSFAFDDDDEDQPAQMPLTGSALINSVLEQSSGTHDFSPSTAQIKLRDLPSKATTSNVDIPSTTTDSTIDTAITMSDDDKIPITPSQPAQQTSITFHHPSTLHVPQVLYPTHIAPRTTPGTHIIYATSIPTQAKRTVTVKGKTAATVNKPSNESSTQEQNDFIPLPPPSLPITTNHIPKWVMGLERLSPKDFECPLSSLPDLMIEPDDYLLSLPNPTDKPRNIFISISAPLRCVTGAGAILESATGLRKFRKYEDRYLISNVSGKPTSCNTTTPSNPISTTTPPAATTTTTANKAAAANPNAPVKEWSEQQLIVPFPSPQTQFGVPSNTLLTPTPPAPFPPQTNHKAQFTINPATAQNSSIVNETTTFAIVIPPMSVIDLCHIVTTTHTHLIHDHTQQNTPLSSFIHTEDYSNYTPEEFLKQFNRYQYPPSQVPLSCPNWLKNVCPKDMPLDLAQRYIYNHIASNPNQGEKVSVGGVVGDESAIAPLPNFIPILHSPLPSHGPYLISQSFCGLLTHHTPQTRYAVDLLCVQGTPVYAPLDAVVIDFQNKACSSGNHVTNLFDWNSITLRAQCSEVIAPFKKTQDDDEVKLIDVLDINNTPSTLSTLSTTHNLNTTDQTALTQPIYIDLVHLSAIAVQKGQSVKRGQLIGYSGSTGFAPSPHLHIQVSLSQHSNATTIPFAFHTNTSTNSSQSTQQVGLHAVLPEAGYALTSQGIIGNDEYKTTFHKAVQLHCSFNNLPIPPAPPQPTTTAAPAPTTTAAKVAAAKASVNKTGAKKTTTNTAQQSQHCCSLDPYAVTSIPLTQVNSTEPLEWPFHMSLGIAQMLSGESK